MLTFAAAVFLLIITPGPGVLSAAGVGAGFGVRAGITYIAGLFAGNALVAGVVISGLGALITADPRVRGVLFALSFAYLAWLALRIAFAGARIRLIERAAAPGVLGGILLQILNPKAYAVNTTFFSGFDFWPDSFIAEVLIKLLIFNLIWIPIHFLWLWFGVAVRRLDPAPAIQRAINVAMAAAMMTVVLLALLARG